MNILQIIADEIKPNLPDHIIDPYISPNTNRLIISHIGDFAWTPDLYLWLEGTTLILNYTNNQYFAACPEPHHLQEQVNIYDLNDPTFNPACIVYDIIGATVRKINERQEYWAATLADFKAKGYSGIRSQ